MPSCPRVVLLIDENQYVDVDHVLQSIHLGCLRLLSYFAHAFHHHADLRSSVLWGYKFYNSERHETGCRYKQYPFLDYTTENFEIFEKELYHRLILQHSKKNSHKEVRRGEQLKVALTELLSDFQWDRPELFSPGKRHSKGSSNEQDVMNLLFIFTPCPASKFCKSVSYFGKDYPDSDSFMSLFLPPVLFEKLIKQSKVIIYWVDTACCPQNLANLKQVHEILDDGLRSVKGSLIPLQHMSLLWKMQQQNNTKHIGIVSVTATLQAHFSELLECRKQVTSTVKRCEFQHKGSTQLFYTELWKHPDDVTVQCIATCGKVILGAISPALLSNQQVPLTYLISPNENMKEMLEDMKILIQQKEAALVTIKVRKNNTAVEFDGIMLPCTPMCGTIVVVNEKIKSKHSLTGNGKCLSNVETHMLEKTAVEMSNVNVGDEWFFYSSTLGFPLTLKNSLKSLQTLDGRQSADREENSKKLLEFFRRKDVKEKDDRSSAIRRKQRMLSKARRMKGMTWARWRLMEYKRKQQEKKLASETKTDVKEPTIDSSIVSVNQINIPEFTCIDDLKEFLLNEYSSLSEKKVIVPHTVSTVVQATWNYFHKESDNAMEAFYDFMNDIVLTNVANIRNTSQSRDSLVIRYLLQAQFSLECLVFITTEERKQQLMEKVVSFLRSVSFEENTFFLRNHMNTVILPGCTDRLADILRHVYDEMMLDLPEGLRLNEDDGDGGVDFGDGDGDSDVGCDSEVQQILLPSSVSYNSSDNSSVTSSQTERRVFRRHSSVVNESTGNKRLIAMNVKKKKTTSKPRKEVREGNDAFSCPSVPKTPKLKRRHSEMSLRTKVPDTPESKQINDLIWKKQERDRRHAKVDKRMKPIDESPVKEIKFPIKKRSLFTRSNSFGCGTSPRRFYTPNEQSSTQDDMCDANSTRKNSNRKFKRHATVTGSMEMHGRYKAFQDVYNVTSSDPVESLAKRRSIVFANFLKSPSKCTLPQSDKSLTTIHREPLREEDVLVEPNLSKPFTRRNIFHQGGSTVTPVVASESSRIDRFSNIRSLKREHSPVEYDSKKPRLSVTDNETGSCPTDTNCDYIISETMALSNERESNSENMFSKFKSNSEATVDWLTEIEQEQKIATPTVLTFHGAFEKLSQTPTAKRCDVKDSPSIVKTKGEAITVSPCLSASSLEFLENAPIISPVLTSKRKLRRRRNIEVDYETN